MDEVLGDGIRDQELCENDCFKELQCQLDLKDAAQNSKFNFVNVDEAIKSLLFDYGSLSEEKKKIIQNYQVI